MHSRRAGNTTSPVVYLQTLLLFVVAGVMVYDRVHKEEDRQFRDAVVRQFEAEREVRERQARDQQNRLLQQVDGILGEARAAAERGDKQRAEAETAWRLGREGRQPERYAAARAGMEQALGSFLEAQDAYRRVVALLPTHEQALTGRRAMDEHISALRRETLPSLEREEQSLRRARQDEIDAGKLCDEAERTLARAKEARVQGRNSEAFSYLRQASVMASKGMAICPDFERAREMSFRIQMERFDLALVEQAFDLAREQVSNLDALNLPGRAEVIREARDRLQAQERRYASYGRALDQARQAMAEEAWTLALNHLDEARRVEVGAAADLDAFEKRIRYGMARAQGLEALRSRQWAEARARFGEGLDLAEGPRDRRELEQALARCDQGEAVDLMARGTARFDEGDWDAAVELLGGELVGRYGGASVGAYLREAQGYRDTPQGFLYVPSGVHDLGSLDTTARNPLRRNVSVPGYYIGIHEVTVAEYAAFVTAGGYDKEAYWDTHAWPRVAELVDASGVPGPATWQGRPPAEGDLPVAGVCLFEARAYARWADRRLPTADEWEVAAGWALPRYRPDGDGGVDILVYPWGNSWIAGAANLQGEGPLPVGSFPQDRSPSGCKDMGGNLFEWTSDAQLRGGAFGFPEEFARRLAVAFRQAVPDSWTRPPTHGFRLAADRAK